ncbi:EAL domain-containing protein [Janthinobacterium fluminis]|uniref:EAL domain-containing protein n=1 Tax=Janthinobacterium fluminis TaxID=2987524 RepID=A0ABT5JWC5_9BURK|nr:EAL domain-containing protein [Janthinobacterium fluminis]MDC8757036.1 EAL domain-containing protein [Janthinobacterium fluminis]
MTVRRPSRPHRFSLLSALPLLVLAAGLGLTWTVWEHERQVSRKELRAHFDFSLRETVSRIEQRMAAYEKMLLGVRALFDASATPGRGGLHDYVASLGLDANFSGVQVIGVAEWVPAAGIGSHVAAMRRHGQPDYAIAPPGRRAQFAPVVQRELGSGVLPRPLGYDVWSEPVRRQAMERARDSGKAALSGKVQLAIDAGPAARPGFIMYLPLYARGRPVDSVAARRANLVGWVYASFRMNQLMATLYGEQPPGLALTIHDGIEQAGETRLYPAAEPAAAPAAILSANEYLVIGGHTWTLSLSALDDYQARFGRNAEPLIAGAGAGLSLLLALLAWLLATGRSRAVRLAAAMTSELRIAAAAFDSREGMMITDAERVVLRVNSAFTETTGYTAADMVGRTPRMLQSAQHDAAFYRDMWLTIENIGGWQGEILARRKSGELYPKWLTISAVKGADGRVTNYISTHQDITERKKAEKKIEELAFFDALTGLPNRTLLIDRLKQAMTAGSRERSYGAVLFIDLDHFKTLNDTLGHDQGDLLLQQVARRLGAGLRAGDTVARLGGDEFVVVLAGLGHAPCEAARQTEMLGEKILATLNKPYQLGGLEYRSTASIGATLFHGHDTSIDELLKQADLAMYKSKETGRNALRFFDPGMQRAVMERAALEAGLREAIREGQFVLHYQAQVAGAGRITGAEALLRWRHPQRGMVAPGDFIPLAEETGLILPLGNWVLRGACAQLAAWAARPQMAPLSIAVNVSAKQFREPDFVATVLAVLAETGANPHRLKLELTESLLVDNVQDIIEKMQALKAKGVGFALDDFGTGYSSLSYLKRLPLDQLKIDQSFVRDVLVDPNDAAIARTIVALAQSLGLGVIAEGVETRTQRDFLAGFGCHAYQGYYFSRPLPLEAFEAYAAQPSACPI